MCRECECGSNRYEHCLTLAINIPQPFECVCSPDPGQVQVQTTDVVAGLLKYNSNLTKYLSKYQGMPAQPKATQPQQMGEDIGNPQLRNGHKSIVDIYNLNVRPPEQRLPADPKQEDKQEKQQDQRNNKIDFQQQTSPRNQYQNGKNNRNKKPKPPKGSNEQKLQKHMKEMSDGSRYLSNTGFKKYFGRECFQNYGRQNTTGVADGIVYNNYLKTFNISPHCGTNIPLTQQTRKRTLIAGDPNKYDNTNPIPESHHGNKADRQAKEGYHRNDLVDMPKIIEQSKQHHEEQQKYNVKITSPPQDDSSRYMNTVYQVSKKLVPPPPPPFIPRSTSKKKINPQFQNKNTQNKQSQRATNESEYTQRQKRTDLQQNRPTQSNKRIQDSYANEIGEQQNTRQTKYAKRGKDQNFNEQQQTPKRQYEQWESEDDGRMQHRIRQKKELVDECYYNIHLAHDIEKKQKPPCPLCAQRRYSKCCCGP